jgi:hypothetical protein
MTTSENTPGALENRLKETEEENELLLLQLQQVQEELEKYYLRNLELQQRQSTRGPATAASGNNWVDDELPKAVAESQRLRALVEVQRKVNELETQNALNARLGDILIHAADSPASWWSVPGKLARIWRASTQRQPPDVLGGMDYEKVVAAYVEGGFEAVERLLAKVFLSPAMQASAYTAVARHLMKENPANAAEAARRGYAIDPRPYRLKWLAFRLQEAGELIEAEAMLDLLPPDTKFSDSEERQASELRYEAKRARLREAQQKTKFSQRRAEAEKQLSSLSTARDEQAKLAAARGREIEALRQERAQLEHAKAALAQRHDEQAQLAAARGREIDTLKQTRVQLEQERAALAERHDEQLQLAAERGRELDALKVLQAQLEQERATLVEQRDEQTQLAVERGREIDGLNTAQAQLEQEKAALAAREEEQAQLAAALAREVEVLKEAQAQLEQEKAVLTRQQDEQTQLAAERGRELDALKAVQAQLEQEKAALAARQEETLKLAQERLNQITELQQQMQSRHAAEAELAKRQHFVQEELVRAEAQLDLIKDLVLREPGL